jgi:hypothetical protein
MQQASKATPYESIIAAAPVTTAAAAATAPLAAPLFTL